MNSNNNIVDEILEKADIVSIVSEYIKLEKAGSSYKGLCPFHNDSNPSFFVSPSKKVAKCMVCGTGGNAITILEKLAKISTKEAIKRLADRYQIRYDYLVDKKQANRKNLYQITKYAEGFYSYYLTNSLPGKAAMDYLAKRDINSDIIKEFRIGLAPSGKDLLYNTLHDQGYSDVDIFKSGMAIGGDYVHDTFINRIMFPITDEENNVIGFSGRIYYDSNESKYFNSFENDLFKKGEVIYNLFNALDSIRKNKRIIIMEGFMDVIAAYRAGLKECVCLMGTAITNEHIAKLKKYNADIIMCLDGDNAGKMATIKALNLLQKNGLNAYAVLLKDNLDPDEYIKAYGSEQFKDIFEKELVDSYTFMYEYYKDSLTADKDNFLAQESFEINVFDMIFKAKNQIITEKFIDKLSLDLDVDKRSINSDFQNYLKGKRITEYNNTTSKKKNDTSVLNGVLKAYEILIRYMMFSRNDFLRISNQLDQISSTQSKYIPNHTPTQIITLIYQYYDLNPDDKYFDIYMEFISKIEVYFRSNEKMIIEKFLDPLAANLKEFYNDRLKNIIVTDEKKKQKEISDCYKKLTCFIIDFGIKKYKELLASNENDYNHYSDQVIRLRREKNTISNS